MAEMAETVDMAETWERLLRWLRPSKIAGLLVWMVG